MEEAVLALSVQSTPATESFTSRKSGSWSDYDAKHSAYLEIVWLSQPRDRGQGVP